MRVCALQAIIALVGIATVSCSDATGGAGSISLCPRATWAALQREGQSWESIPVTRSTHPLGDGERIGLARIHRDSLQIFYVTAEQAEAMFACEIPPTRELNGTVQGMGTAVTAGAIIAMGVSYGYPGGNGGEAFNVPLAPNGPTDLVATAFGLGPATIIRRGLDYPGGSTIPVLDFSSDEAFGLQANTLTVIGTGNLAFFAQYQVITQRGTEGFLNEVGTTSGSALSMYSVPESRLLDGELNFLTVFGPLSRRVTVYYRLPSDLTVALGPLASMPTITRTGTSPNLTTRIDAAWQPEYGSQITVRLSAPPPSPEVWITGSKEYFGGTPTTWSFTIPDLLAVEGFPARRDPRDYSGVGITVTDQPYLFSRRSARDGETYRLARSP